jgi:hypothetical protein
MCVIPPVILDAVLVANGPYLLVLQGHSFSYGALAQVQAEDLAATEYYQDLPVLMRLSLFLLLPDVNIQFVLVVL